MSSMGNNSKNKIIDYLPLENLDREIIDFLSSGKPEEEIIEFLIKRFQ